MSCDQAAIADKSPGKFTKPQKAMEEATAFSKDPKNLNELVGIFSKSGASGLTEDQLRRAISQYQPLDESMFDCRLLPVEITFYSKFAGSLTESDGVACDEYMWSGAKAYMITTSTAESRSRRASRRCTRVMVDRRALL